MNAKKLIAMALALVMILGLAVSPVSVRAAGDANPYIADLIGYYKSYQEAAETDILRTLDAMAQVDPVQAEAWTQIMDYWSYINTEMQVHDDPGSLRAGQAECHLLLEEGGPLLPL